MTRLPLLSVLCTGWLIGASAALAESELVRLQRWLYPPRAAVGAVAPLPARNPLPAPVEAVEEPPVLLAPQSPPVVRAEPVPAVEAARPHVDVVAPGSKVRRDEPATRPRAPSARAPSRDRAPAAEQYSCEQVRMGASMPCAVIRAHAGQYATQSAEQRRHAAACLTAAQRRAVAACFKG